MLERAFPPALTLRRPADRVLYPAILPVRQGRSVLYGTLWLTAGRVVSERASLPRACNTPASWGRDTHRSLPRRSWNSATSGFEGLSPPTHKSVNHAEIEGEPRFPLPRKVFQAVVAPRLLDIGQREGTRT